MKIDPARLLVRLSATPGPAVWDGEHVGKWLHAATLAWVNTGDPALRKKLDYVAAELIKCQLDDGYLGTYVEKDRWTEWDVWAHKYNLIGLITYMRYTGNLEPLPACRRMADLLCKTFGDEPGQRDIIKAGQHMGMAPTSVLEPMVLLYRSDRRAALPRFLQIHPPRLGAAQRAEDHLHAAHRQTRGQGRQRQGLRDALLPQRRAGILPDDGRAEDPRACLNAWQDIVDNRLYLTGAASYGEFFHDDFDLPNVANVGETCVTVTWLQFNAQLLRLTGEARFAEQLEHVILNQLFGAQSCNGSAWGYYVQMEGKKPYSSTLDGHCCLSSGPRGIALIPTFAVSTDADGVVVNLYDAGTAKLTLRDGTAVVLTTETLYPSDGKIVITVDTISDAPFTFKARIPAWCRESSLKVNGKPVSGKVQVLTAMPPSSGIWAKGDKVELNIKLEPRVVVGDHTNNAKEAIMYGPLVLATDEALLGTSGLQLNGISMSTDVNALAIYSRNRHRMR